MRPSMEKRTCPAGELTNIDERYVDFGLADFKGRAVGYLVTTSEVDLVPYSEIPGDVYPPLYDLAPGHYFVLDGHYAVNRSRYGTSPYRRFFPSAASRSLAVDEMLEGARGRAYGKSVRGAEELAERRGIRSRDSSGSGSREAAKLARREAREAEAAARVPAAEAEVQVFLDDADFMAYLAAHPWPLVIPGPPSMRLTAHDHIVTYGIRRIDGVRSDRRESRPNAALLSELTSMLRLLRESAKLFAQGLPPDSPSSRKFLNSL
jgi:hypothetical protein